MEFRILGNENPLGSRRAFEDRVNLHLAVGWQLHGALVAEAVKAGDWQKNLGLNRPEQSLFAEKENNEETSELRVSKERLRKELAHPGKADASKPEQLSLE